MKPFIQIDRYPYEEPYNVKLVITASNGNFRGRLDFYVSTDALREWANGLEEFPPHANSVFSWEIGSEDPDERSAYYFRFRLFTIDSVGHCAIELRFNNNEALPHREISEFCILAEPLQINRLGQLLREFAQLRHRVLVWSVSDGALYKTMEDAKQELGGYAWR